jgi:hypothetical protein
MIIEPGRAGPGATRWHALVENADCCALTGLFVRVGLQTTDTKAQDGQQHPGSDALEIGRPFVNAGGRDIYIYMTDVYRDFPYERTSYAQYQGYMKTEVEQVLTSPYKNRIVLVPYHEPDGNKTADICYHYRPC